jgi:uncharacterized membrane protein
MQYSPESVKTEAPMENLNVVMINVTSRDDGLRVMDRLDAGKETGEINVEDVAMVYKTDKGKVKIQQTADATAGKGAVKGGGLGLLVGIVAAPLVPAVAVGAGIGALAGKFRDRGISDPLIKAAGQAIETYGAVVFVLADQANSQVVTNLIDEAVAKGAKVEYQVLSEDAQELLRLQLIAGPKVAVGVQVDIKGMTLDQYDEAIKQMGFEPQGAGAPGSLFHCVTKTADGIRASDVWTTQEDFEKFAEEKIGPITKAVGVKSQPETQYFDVHNYLTAG